MIKFLKSLLSEDSTISCLRFMSLLSLLFGAGVAFMSLYGGCRMADATAVVGIFVGAAFGGKVGQKYVESRTDDK